MKLEIRSSASRLSWRVGGRLRFLERRRRARFETAALPPGAEEGPVHGFCFVCGVPSVFPMDAEHSWMEGGVRRLNWRERLICPTCGLNCRMRAGLHLIDLVLKPGQGSAIYATEQLTAFFSHLQKRYPWAVGSEYLGPDFPRGALDERGLRHETVEDLSFGDATLDLLITEDVMEHVAEPVRALQEFSRVLKPGGVLLLSVPFDERRRTTVRRASRQADGTVVHHLPPAYHVDPLDPQGCLVFSDFGWDLLEMLAHAGFSSSRLFALWSADYAYLGSTNLYFVARR